MSNEPSKIERLRHRSWEDVALAYNDRTGENLSESQVLEIGMRALKKVARELKKQDNYKLREAVAAEWGIII